MKLEGNFPKQAGTRFSHASYDLGNFLAKACVPRYLPQTCP